MSSNESLDGLFFGDLLALARQRWIQQMAAALAERGYSDYRRSDAFATRVLRHGALSLGELSRRLGVSRQIARQVADGLQKRQYAVTSRADVDRRRVEVHLTGLGEEYAAAVVDVITLLNERIVNAVDGLTMDATRLVLRAVIDGEVIARSPRDA